MSELSELIEINKNIERQNEEIIRLLKKIAGEQDELEAKKEKIMSLRDAKKEVNNEGIIDANREQQYREQIRKLKEDKENLIRQLVEMEDLRKEIKMLKEQIKRLKGSQC